MRAVVHVGFEKTGTTSIQKAMRQNAALLATAKLHYSELCGDAGRHDFLPYLTAPEEFAQHFREAAAMYGRRSEARPRIRQALREEISRCCCETVVFSSEHCSTKLHTVEDVRNLRDFLTDNPFDDVEIIIYLRRQDRLAVSYFSTHLRLGGFIADPFAATCEEILDYEHLLYRWASVFGTSNVKVYVYDDIIRGGLSVVQHFATSLGLPSLASDCVENARLSPVEQQLMLAINAQMGPFDGNTIRSAISLVASQMNASLQTRIRRADAESFMRNFESSNEAVRGGFAPRKSTLFDEDYSEYPDEPFANHEALTALAINALAEGGRIISDLETQIRALRHQ